MRHPTMKCFAKAGVMNEGGQVYNAGCRWKKAPMDPDVRQTSVPTVATVPSPAASGRVAEHPLPAHALLSRYGGDRGYADCYVATVARRVTQAEYVEAFYTTRLFKLERWILAVLAARPSTDPQAGELARAERDRFAAWTVEDRTADQLLLADALGGTRSWLSSEPQEGGGTRLFFGSAVVPRRRGGSAKPRMGLLFHALLGFHRLYSRALLRAARQRLERGT
jgi:hypothetical protein